MTTPTPPALPPTPIASDLADPTYQYLNCPTIYCCSDQDQARIAAWVQDGLRPDWHHMVRRWHADGHTVADVMAYAPTDPADTLRGNIVVPCITEFLHHRIRPEDVHTYLAMGAVFTGGNIVDLASARAHAPTVVAYLQPLLDDPRFAHQRATLGLQFTADYLLWAQLADGRRDLITALLAAHWPWDDIATVLTRWVDTDLAIPADRIVRLHRAGLSPDELAAHPHLRTADVTDLAALAALRA